MSRGVRIYLASLGKALQPGDLEEGDDGKHDSGQGINGQPVLLRSSTTFATILSFCD